MEFENEQRCCKQEFEFWRGYNAILCRTEFSLQNPLKNLPQFNNVFLTESFDDHRIILFSECSYRWMESTFSAGGFESLSKKQPRQTESETTEKPEVSKAPFTSR